MKSRATYFRGFLAALLLVSNSFGAISAVLAQVAPGTPIKNTATATFNDGTTTYNATSNEVVITVAEVAGITISANPPNVANPNAGGQTYVDFVITNTGNDPTQFFIPGTATLTGTGATGSTVGTLQIVAVDGTTLGTPVNVPAAGGNTGTLLGTTNGSIKPNPGTGTTGTITVRVPVTVAPGATTGQTINVALGNTAAANTQNQDRTGSVDANDVYTVDNPDGTPGETNGAPVNGTREAMATTSSPIKVNARLQAFSTVLKAVSSYDTKGTPNDVSDDILTYGLALRVENPTTPPDGLVVSDLYGTALKVNGASTTPYVLVSDAIPTGMKLSTTNPTAPSGWQVVYTTDALAVNALNANWSTTRPASGTITRVGFIFDTTAKPLPKGAAAITGFTLSVTPDAGFTGGQVANIAQTFGQSQPGAVVPGTSTQIVYDESGDQTSNNGLGGANPDPTTTGGVTADNGGITDGKADPAKDGTDSGTGTDPTAASTNTGSDTNNGTKTVGGEDNVYTIAATPLNGPNGQPGATGPTDTNDDFTNKSIVVPAGKKPTDDLTDAETAPVTFTNTVQNTNGSSQVITLLPTPPATPSDLIDGTKVTITDPANTSNTVTYTYTAGGFTTTSPNPVRITVSAGGTANYTTTIDLPAAPQLKGYSVPITAFIDANNDGKPNNEPSNITIDRVYTNYLELKKEARLLESDGTTPVAGTAGSFTTDQTALSVAATPGRVIEYRITYTNISKSGGTNSVTLPANNLIITEDGNAAPNTWFSITVDPKYSTSGGNGSATQTGGGTITVTSAQNGTVNDIQKYVNTVTSVAPGGTGTFTFQRKIK